MTEISANIRLRPTRIGFLVNPTDLCSIKKIMQFNTCIWGGEFNPIIPVFQTPPKEWRADKYERVRGLSIARGYVEFFEPDVYVEAQRGLLEKAGLENLRQGYSLEPHVCTLGELLKIRDHRSYSEPFYGLNITDVFSHIYKTEQRFEHRDEQQSVIVKPDKNTGLAEAVFGCYPSLKQASYIQQGYEDVFRPEKAEVNPEAWLSVFRDNARSPLHVTRYGLEFPKYWYHDPIIYIFDPSRPTDLIDLWNIRIEPYPVLPVPLHWVEKLSGFLRQVLKNNHRPVQGNPNGMMHRCTIEFGRSISIETAENLIRPVSEEMPKGSISVKFKRNRIWEPLDKDFVRGHEVIKITASEARKSLPVKEENQEITSRFETLSPMFASEYGGHNFRWMNAVQVSAYGPERVATILPYNTYNREWPQLGMGGNRIIAGSEGWVFGQRFKNSDEVLHLLKKEDAIIGALKQLGVQATLSDPGHIAKQVLDHVGGLWGTHYLAHTSVIKLLNNMAGSVRRRQNSEGNSEEHFGGRTASVKLWDSFISENNGDGSLRALKLQDYTDRNIIRLGLESACPHCQGKNWHDLDELSYDVSCERCLNNYAFPQAESKARKWKYRVTGPFSVPDYARGAYSALLTLRTIDKLGVGDRGEMTFSTALDLKFDGLECEADFVALKKKTSGDKRFPPELVVGECKSFGKGELVKSSDLKKLRHIAKKLPGAVIVISVMRDHFTEDEKTIITKFVKWAGRLNERAHVTNPVILLTGHELFLDFLLTATWKDLGKPHIDYADYEHTKDLYSLAQATQAIYLGLPSFYERRIKIRPKSEVVSIGN